jgi:uncharacterized protein
LPEASVVARFLANACPDHHVRGGYAHVVAKGTAERLLRKHPSIAGDSIHTAVVCGDLAEVERILRARPGAAREPGGSKGSADAKGATFVLEEWEARHPHWEPLLYLAFTRLDHRASNENATTIAKLLLDHGADPNAYFMAGDSRYTPLTGVIGEGEEERGPHPRRDELTRLLLGRGAEPYDIQVVYNIHFRGDVLWYLRLMHERAFTLGRQADWNDPEWSMLSMGNYGCGARWHLEIALRFDDVELATWCLDHGADPNAPPARDPRFPRASLHEEALRRGYLDMARLLESRGARLPDPRSVTLLEPPAAMMLAVERDRAGVVSDLLDRGLSPDLASPEHGDERPLHTAGYWGSVASAKVLIERGAAIDPRESSYGATPLGFAVWAQRQGMIDLLGPLSRDLWNLAFTGHVDPLRALLGSEPALAKAVHPDGETPLMRLPDDETKAIEVVRLFLDHGADPGARNAGGKTAADLAAQRGLDRVVELLSRA